MLWIKNWIYWNYQQGRRKIRPYFQGSALMRKFYDVLTFVMARFYMGMFALPFVFLDVAPAHEFYKYVASRVVAL